MEWNGWFHYLLLIPLFWMIGIGAYFGAQCEKHGMLVRVAGDSIMMSPPFIMTSNQVDEVDSIHFFSFFLFKKKIKN